MWIWRSIHKNQLLLLKISFMHFLAQLFRAPSPWVIDVKYGVGDDFNLDSWVILVLYKYFTLFFGTLWSRGALTTSGYSWMTFFGYFQPSYSASFSSGDWWLVIGDWYSIELARCYSPLTLWNRVFEPFNHISHPRIAEIA